MKVATFCIGLLAALVPVTTAWSKEDREIFRVRDELAGALGADVTFYDFVGVPAAASVDEINKAYRKKSRALHPDKVKQQLAAEKARAKKAAKAAAPPPTAAEVRAAIKRASDMQARLSIVTNILRGPDRARYDHFLANGFPVWKGTGYYYNRYRPGFATVLVGLFIFVGGAGHYLALYTSWKRQHDFLDRYIRYARHAAWGQNLGIDLDGVSAAAAAAVPDHDDLAAAAATGAQQPPAAAAMNRKQRRMQERDAKKEAAKDAAASSSSSRRGRRAAPAAAANSGAGSGSDSATPTRAPTAASGPTGSKKRVIAENGKVLVVDSLGDVYLEQVDENGRVEELLLDINEVMRPTFRNTAVYRLPAWAYGLVARRVFGRKTAGKDEYDDEEDEDDNDNDVQQEGAQGHGTAAVASAKPRKQPTKAVDTDAEADGSHNSRDSSPGKATPSTDSNEEEFELLDKSTESLRGDEGAAAKATGNSSSSNNKPNKPNKRRNKKR